MGSGKVYLFCLGLGLWVGCKNETVQSKPGSASQKVDPPKTQSTYVPPTNSSPFAPASMPEVGKETTCPKEKLLVAGYCIDLVEMQAFSKGDSEFYAFGNLCKTSPDSCGVPKDYVFKEVRLRAIDNPPEALKTVLAGIEALVKNDIVVFTTSAGESVTKVKNEGYTSKGIVAWLSPFPAGEGKQMVRFEKENSFRFGLTGYGPGEGYLGSSLGYALEPL